MEKQNINNNLRKLRKLRGFTQSELAEHTGLKQGQVSRFENGETDISSFYVNILCGALKCTPNQLFGYEELAAKNYNVDEKLMKDVTLTIENIVRKKKLRLDRDKILNICLNLYTDVQKYKDQKIRFDLSEPYVELYLEKKLNEAS